MSAIFIDTFLSVCGACALAATVKTSESTVTPRNLLQADISFLPGHSHGWAAAPQPSRLNNARLARLFPDAYGRRFSGAWRRARQRLLPTLASAARRPSLVHCLGRRRKQGFESPWAPTEPRASRRNFSAERELRH